MKRRLDLGFFICYSPARLLTEGRLTAEKCKVLSHSNKTLLPADVLLQLVSAGAKCPYTFEVRNTVNGSELETHCGVMEFSANAGEVIVPEWTMRQLGVQDGDNVELLSCDLPLATYVRMRPNHHDFGEITNSKAVLERELRWYTCLTRGDVIPVRYDECVYEITIVEVKPNRAVVIVECDVKYEVEMVTDGGGAGSGVLEELIGPVYEKEIEKYRKSEVLKNFTAFRSVGKKLKNSAEEDPPERGGGGVSLSFPRGIPNLEWRFGTVVFIRKSVDRESSSEEKENEDFGSKSREFRPFSGVGKHLKKIKRSLKGTV